MAFCELCNRPLSSATSDFINILLKAVPRLCCFVNQGCKRILKPGDDHELYCSYKTTECREPNCKQTVQISQILKHYEEKHPDRWWLKKMKGSLEWPDFNPNADRSDYVPVLVSDEFYYIRMKTDVKERVLKLTLDSFPVSKPEADVYLAFKLGEGNGSYSKLVKANVLGGGNTPSQTLQPVTDSGSNPEEYVLKVPTSGLPSFVNEKKSLELSYAFLTF